MPTARHIARSLALAAAVLPLAAGCMTPSAGAKKDKSLTDQMGDSVRSFLHGAYHDTEMDAKMARGEELFAAQKYADAQALFTDLAENKYNPAGTLEKARFLEGECLRVRGKLPAAMGSYHRLLQDFPGGGSHGGVYCDKAAERMYAIAEVWLKETLDGMDKANAGKLDVKLPNPLDESRPFLDAEGELVKALENIAVGAPGAPCAEKAMFWAGYLHYARGRYDDADHFFSTLVEMYKDSPLRPEAVKYAVLAKNRSTGGAVYDGQKPAEALQLVNGIEATDPTYRRDPAKQEWLTRQKLSIRLVQAEKDFESAEYYRRTNHPGSAYFYYELVTRRYPGTKYSDLAKSRLDEMAAIKQKQEADRAAGKVDPLKEFQNGVDKLLGNVKPDADDDKPRQQRPQGARPSVPGAGM